MCGIVGIVTKNKNGFNAPDLDVFEDLLIIDSTRGEDGIGVFMVDNEGKVTALKQSTYPHHFLRSNEWKSLREDAIRSGSILIGHNRKATMGTISSENSHPFLVKPIVLVHNGSITNHKSIADVEVDSHALAHFLAKNEPEKLSELKGAIATIWYDVNKATLFAYRNLERPLHYATDFSNVYFSSEDGALAFIERKYNKKLTISSFEHEKLFKLSDNRMEEIAKIAVERPFTGGWAPGGRIATNHKVIELPYQKDEYEEAEIIPCYPKNLVPAKNDGDHHKLFFRAEPPNRKPRTAVFYFKLGTPFNKAAEWMEMECVAGTIQSVGSNLLTLNYIRVDEKILTKSGEDIFLCEFNLLPKNCCVCFNSIDKKDKPEDLGVVMSKSGYKLLCKSCIEKGTEHALAN